MTENAGMLQWINQFMNSRIGTQEGEGDSPPPAQYPRLSEEAFQQHVNEINIPRYHIPRLYRNQNLYTVQPGQTIPNRNNINWDPGEANFFRQEYPTVAEEEVQMNNVFEYNQELVDKAIQHLRGLEDFSNAINPEVVSRNILGPEFEYDPPRRWGGDVHISSSGIAGTARDKWSDKIAYQFETGILNQWDIGRLLANIHEFINNKTERVFVQLAKNVHPRSELVADFLHQDDIFLTIYCSVTGEGAHEHGRTIKINDVEYGFPVQTYIEDQFAQLNELGDLFEGHGYEIIKAKVSRRVDQPVAAIKDKNLVVFFTSDLGDQNFHRFINDLLSRMVEENSGSEIWEQTNGTVRSILASYQGLDDVLSGRRQSLTATRRTVVEHRDGLAASIRRELDIAEEIRHMENNRLDMAIDRFKSLGALGTIIESIRPIRSHSINFQNGSPIIEFVTYPYVMGYDGSRIEIPELKVVIDTNDSYIESAIRIHCNDESSTWYHPHVYHGECCFGHASGALAESFARRDWESMIRILVTYITQYNNSSPHIQFFDLAEDYLGYSERDPGWVYPEPITQEPDEPVVGSGNITEEPNDGSESARDDGTEDDSSAGDTLGEQVLSEGSISL